MSITERRCAMLDGNSFAENFCESSEFLSEKTFELQGREVTCKRLAALQKTDIIGVKPLSVL